MSESLTRAELEAIRSRADKMRVHPVAKHFGVAADALRLLDAYEEVLEENERLRRGGAQTVWEGRITIDLLDGTVTGQAVEESDMSDE